MKKKIALALVAAVAVVGGVAAMSAYEAHVINVTAHIENALSVPTKEISFGTVFPQEYVDETFTMTLSQSFQDQYNQDPNAAYGLQYVINQKLKCVNDVGEFAPVNYWDDQCPKGYEPMQSLCPFLSKEPVIDNEQDTQDVGVPSYFQGTSCSAPSGDARGRLNMLVNDISDTWNIDLKVPPVAGTVGQDWPASCSSFVVPIDGVDYGCDLWVEVERIVRGQ